MKKLLFLGLVISVIILKGFAIESCEKLKNKFKKD
jgi:hypothetical protein